MTRILNGRLTDLIDAATGLSEEDWLERLEDLAYDLGFFEPLGPDHSAVFVKRGSRLLVTFETIQSARGRPVTDVPLGWEVAQDRGWSQLCILAHSETWFRHRAVYLFFDKMIDDGLFDDFDQVLFYGAGSCGYAAAAFSVAAPGATVVAVQPQATLDPSLTDWEPRFRHMRRISFTDRYGYAPDMLDAAERAFVLYDPAEPLNATHAALFTRENVTKLRCPHLDDDIETFLYRSQILGQLVDQAMTGDLEAADFNRLFRLRRTDLPYLDRLLGALEARQRPFLTAILCRRVLQGGDIARYQHQLDRAERDLAGSASDLPAPAGA